VWRCLARRLAAVRWPLVLASGLSLVSVSVLRSGAGWLLVAVGGGALRWSLGSRSSARSRRTPPGTALLRLRWAATLPILAFRRVAGCDPFHTHQLTNTTRRPATLARLAFIFFLSPSAVHRYSKLYLTVLQIKRLIFQGEQEIRLPFFSAPPAFLYQFGNPIF
jgi:hypothetical protein